MKTVGKITVTKHVQDDGTARNAITIQSHSSLTNLVEITSIQLLERFVQMLQDAGKIAFNTEAYPPLDIKKSKSVTSLYDEDEDE